MLTVISYRLAVTGPLLIGGTAAAPGVCDRMTVLDHGLPCVPASSIRGRTKDALRGFLLESGAFDEAAVCRRIFGAPGGATRGFDFTGAYYSRDDADRVRCALGVTKDGPDIPPTVERRARHQRNEALRRPKDDHLFVDGAGMVFGALAGSIRERANHALLDVADREWDHRLLVLALRLIDSIGATRNRGYGECEFSPATGDAPAWQESIEWVCNQWRSEKAGARP